MTHEEQYLFDLRGYLVIKSAIDPPDLERLNAVIDTSLEHSRFPESGYAHTGMPDDALGLNDDPLDGPVDFGAGRLLDWGPELRELVGHEPVLDYLVDLIGPGLRLDHQYAIFMRPGHTFSGRHALHNGGTPFDPSQCYIFRDGRFFNGLTVVSYALTDSPEGSGGFCCIPGSHKSNLPLPQGYADVDHPVAAVEEIGVQAGDAIIFTEAMTHGAMRWKANHERRTLIYKYSPGYMQWERGSPFADEGVFAAEIQRQLLRGPFEGSRTGVREELDETGVQASSHSTHALR